MSEKNAVSKKENPFKTSDIKKKMLTDEYINRIWYKIKHWNEKIKKKARFKDKNLDTLCFNRSWTDYYY